MPVLVIVAGPNGSGKTTLVRSGILADLVDVPKTSINADDYARGLASGGPPTDAQSLLAAQVSDARLDEQIAQGESVVVETVLSSDKYKARVQAARAAGFRIVLVYVTVRIAGLNVTRVEDRLAVGGHGVPHDRILARRTRSHGMFVWFAQEADEVFVFDNSSLTPSLVAEKRSSGWLLYKLEQLAPDLAEAIRALAAAP